MDIEVTPLGIQTPTGLRPCALGRGGIGCKEKEGDGITPMGRLPLRRVFYRSDRTAKPETGLPIQALNKEDGWCDDPTDDCYNKLVRLPHNGRCEDLWREDGLYDVVVELGYNDDPVVPGRGSALFMHVARSGYEPTEGCVALSLSDLLDLLRHCKPGDHLMIKDSAARK